MLIPMNTRAEIEADIYEKASVNRGHILAFLRLLPTSDAQAISTATRTWLNRLHADPYYSKIIFPAADGEFGSGIDRIIGDIDSYGRITAETLLEAPPVPEVHP